MTKFHHTITTDNITVLAGGQIIQIPSTHVGFKALAEHLKSPNHDLDTIRNIADKRAALGRLTAGQVSVIGSTVYYKGVPVRSALAKRLVELTDSGFDATPWALFMDKIMQNPSEVSRERLFEFLDRWKAPLTAEGNFVAFKGVNDDYSSTRNDPKGNKVYNTPGAVVEMPREDVVEDPNITCASGLHACASHYLDGFWGTKNHVLALEINPIDVVSIPIDYNLSKMRVCRYTVIGDIEDTRHRDSIEQAHLVSADTNGRVSAAAPQPLTSESFTPAPPQHFYNGEPYIKTDNGFDEGSVVLVNETGEVGIVLYMYEVDFADPEHPQNTAWMDGEIAGGDVPDMVCANVQLEDGTNRSFVFADEDSAGLTVLEAAYDEDEDDDEEDVSVDGLSFYHDQTGRTFTAQQVIDGVAIHGQRGFERTFGVPRTTLQDWLRRANAAGY